jgi:hypothetical protein
VEDLEGEEDLVVVAPGADEILIMEIPGMCDN